MKNKFAFLCMAIGILFFNGCQSTTKTGQSNNLGKVLVLYYTWSESGTTENVAKMIQGLTNADIIKIEPVIPFPSAFNTTEMEMIQWVEQQKDQKALPEIKDLGINPDAYDFIFIGTPVWFGTLSLPIESLLSKINFEGKSVSCFAMANSSPGGVLGDFEKQAKNAQVEEGISFILKSEQHLEDKVIQWVNGLRR